MRQRVQLSGACLLLTIAVVRSGGVATHSQAIDPSRALQSAQAQFDGGRYREAAEAFRRARGGAPDVARAAEIGLVRSLLRVGEFREAFLEAEEATRRAPATGEVFAVYGDALWALGRFRASEQAQRDALAMAPGLAAGRHGLARVLAARSRLDAALVEAQAAVAAAPRDGEYHYTLGSIYQRQKDFTRAVEAFEQYVSLLPRREHSDKAAWARAQVLFLRSFARKRPLDVKSSPGKVHVVPFRVVDDKVVVRARINGGLYTDFVLDTGAELTIISAPLAYRRKVMPVTYVRSAGVGEVGLRGLQVASIDTLQIGTMTIENVPCLIKNPPLQGLPTRETEALSPLVLGMSMSIDYRLRLLTFGDALPAASDAQELPLWLHRLAMVEGTLNSAHHANFVVDTGGEVISISQATAGLLGPPPSRKIPLKVYGTSGWDPDAFLMPSVDLAFEAVRMPRTAVVVLNLDAPSVLLGFELGGIVGHQFLSKYTVTMDLRRSVLALGI